jgi:hypothetical protein
MNHCKLPLGCEDGEELFEFYDYEFDDDDEDEEKNEAADDNDDVDEVSIFPLLYLCFFRLFDYYVLINRRLTKIQRRSNDEILRYWQRKTFLNRNGLLFTIHIFSSIVLKLMTYRCFYV